MQEIVRKPNAAELLQRIAKDIAAFHNGGPNLRVEHLQLGGLPEGWINATWDQAEGKSPPLQPAQFRRRTQFRQAKPPEEAAAKAEKPDPVPAPSISGEAKPDFAAKLDAASQRHAEPKPQPEPEPEQKPEPDTEPEQEPELQAAALPILVPSPPAIGDIWGRALAEMNRSHAVIESVGGKTVIASWQPSANDDNRMELVYSTQADFLLRYSNKFITYPIPDIRGGVRDERVPVGRWWLNNTDRRQFRGVIFRPGALPQINNCLNLWQGWGVEDRSGDWRLLLKHILRVICGGNGEFAKYVIRWIAWSIQHPDAPAEVALVLIGQKGTGKGTLVRCLERNIQASLIPSFRP
jgi:hypothetical protein